MGFYFVTTGWIFEISLCENSINQKYTNVQYSAVWQVGTEATVVRKIFSYGLQDGKKLKFFHDDPEYTNLQFVHPRRRGQRSVELCVIVVVVINGSLIDQSF